MISGRRHSRSRSFRPVASTALYRGIRHGSGVADRGDTKHVLLVAYFGLRITTANLIQAGRLIIAGIAADDRSQEWQHDA
jgi:hypothetical protein